MCSSTECSDFDERVNTIALANVLRDVLFNIYIYAVRRRC